MKSATTQARNINMTNRDMILVEHLVDNEDDDSEVDSLCSNDRKKSEESPTEKVCLTAQGSSDLNFSSEIKDRETSCTSKVISQTKSSRKVSLKSKGRAGNLLNRSTKKKIAKSKRNSSAWKGVTMVSKYNNVGCTRKVNVSKKFEKEKQILLPPINKTIKSKSTEGTTLSFNKNFANDIRNKSNKEFSFKQKIIAEKNSIQAKRISEFVTECRNENKHCIAIQKRSKRLSDPTELINGASYIKNLNLSSKNRKHDISYGGLEYEKVLQMYR